MPTNESDFRPALSLVGSPTKRSSLLELAVEAERRGFDGIACPSLGAAVAMCVSLAHATSSIKFWTSIQPIYYSHPVESANTAAHIHEISNGRFAFGIGVSHGPVTKRLGVQTGRPLQDIEHYVATMKATERFSGALPPILLATLRDKMLDLATKIADGAIWANASLRDIDRQARMARGARTDDFRLLNMVPTVISDDVEAARAINRKTMTGYVSLPNYRNYWRAAGFDGVMDRIEEALPSRDDDTIRAAMNDEWLDDCTISGNASYVRERLFEWHTQGVQPIAVMSSTNGGQAVAIKELFAAFD
jgi:alkanesulfonate monooxygenase SsuD/methylene tetrahydromethanopterin reductase-like flavin-dependent oxidoreductase (luciferase family)